MAGSFRDTDGNTWSLYENEFQQRKALCIEGPRKGRVIDSPFSDPTIWKTKKRPVDHRTEIEKALDNDFGWF